MSVQMPADFISITTTMETQLPGKVGPIILPHGGTVGGRSLMIWMASRMAPIRYGGTESGGAKICIKLWMDLRH